MPLTTVFPALAPSTALAQSQALAGRVRMGLPLRSVPDALRGATRQALRAARTADSLPRATFHMDASTGDRWFAFAGAGRSTVVKATAALAEALAGVRMGELVVDTNNARDVLARVDAMEARIALVEAGVRALGTVGTASQLPGRLAEWWTLRGKSVAEIDRIRKAGNRALLFRTPQSVSDADLLVLDGLENKAIDMEEILHGLQASNPNLPKPGTGTGTGTGGTQSLSSLIASVPWWGWGAGAAAVLGILAVASGAFSRSSPATVVVTESRRSAR